MKTWLSSWSGGNNSTGLSRLSRKHWRYMPTKTKWNSSTLSSRRLNCCISSSKIPYNQRIRLPSPSNFRTCLETRKRRTPIKTNSRQRICRSSSKQKETKKGLTSKISSNYLKTSSLVWILYRYSVSHNCSYNYKNAHPNLPWPTQLPIPSFWKGLDRTDSSKLNNRIKNFSS